MSEKMTPKQYLAKAKPARFFDERRPLTEVQLKIPANLDKPVYAVKEFVDLADGIYVGMKGAVVVEKKTVIGVYGRVFNKNGYQLDLHELQEDYVIRDINVR